MKTQFPQIRIRIRSIHKIRLVCDMCDKIFGKKEDNFHFPIRARYAS